jgi:hypothetical protein
MSLIDDVRAVCNALASAGWRDLLLDVTDGALDITTSNLADALAAPLAVVDRTVAGFQDFAVSGNRAVTPMSPAESLLYHALASPLVHSSRGAPLAAFPTPAQIESVENYVYAAQPPLADIWRDGDSSAVVVFALEYRTASRTPHRRHADLCFSRTGVARVGTTQPLYDATTRQWTMLDDDNPFAFRPRPVRYAPFIAVSRPGEPGHFPDRFVTGDDGREFWVPIHKLFDGDECVDGITIQLQWNVGHVNEKLRRFHKTMAEQGYETGWTGDALDQPPFVFADGIAELSTDPDHGSGYVMPVVHGCLVEKATYDGQPLAMTIPADLQPAHSHSRVLERYFSGLEVSPFGPMPIAGNDQSLRPQGLAHPAPEILNARHKVLTDGTEVNLNDTPNVGDVVGAGGYAARHFVDFTGDGWIGVTCAALEPFIPRTRSAYSLVSGPDFFPYCDQLQLMEWAATLPADIREGLWTVLPRALSDTRLAPNQTFGPQSGFSPPAGPGLSDTTVTAVVCQPIHHDQPAGTWSDDGLHWQTALPDGASGVFDPGWDVTTDAASDADATQLYLAAYGLGTPFVEDVKICAALGTYWPAVAPDAARTYQPDHYWPTVSPLTDEEIGIVGDMPWDGVRGPVQVGNVVEYTDIDYADYADNALAGKFTAALTAKIDFAEYTRRVWVMAWVYDALGIRLPPAAESDGKPVSLFQRMQTFLLTKATWAVLSFRAQASVDHKAAVAAQSIGREFTGEHFYGGTLYRYGADRPGPTFKLRHVEIIEQRMFLTDLVTMLISTDGISWQVAPIPTSSS